MWRSTGQMSSTAGMKRDRVDAGAEELQKPNYLWAADGTGLQILSSDGRWENGHCCARNDRKGYRIALDNIPPGKVTGVFLQPTIPGSSACTAVRPLPSAR